MNRKIINILCPHCKYHYLIRRKRDGNNFQWECLKCVYTYSDSWFNKFTQFEKFVAREMEYEI